MLNILTLLHVESNYKSNRIRILSKIFKYPSTKECPVLTIWVQYKKIYFHCYITHFDSETTTIITFRQKLKVS